MQVLCCSSQCNRDITSIECHTVAAFIVFLWITSITIYSHIRKRNLWVTGAVFYVLGNAVTERRVTRTADHWIGDCDLVKETDFNLSLLSFGFVISEYSSDISGRCLLSNIWNECQNMALRAAKIPPGHCGSMFDKGAITITFVICLWVGHWVQSPASASESHSVITEDTEWLAVPPLRFKV